jgi:arylsulfatase A-like enzyme
VRGKATEDRIVSVSENWGFAAFETEGHKLVVDEDAVSACQLFDLREDPEEDRNLLADPRSRMLADDIMEAHVRPFFRTPPARPHPSIFTGGTTSEQLHQGV